MKHRLNAFAIIPFAAALVPAQAPNPRPAVPVEPVENILDAFRSHSIVALGDHHGNQQDHEFRLMLVRDSRFDDAVNDIVVEFGNARYQDIMDRFVRGEEVPYESLRKVWQNTTQVEYDWDLPIYEEFFRAVRSVNTGRPRARQLRVLLGDPPIDWDRVRTRDDLMAAMGNRDAHAVEVIRREVLAKGRRALVIYGEQHLIRKNTVPEAADEWARGLVAQLERPAIAAVFTITAATRQDLKMFQPDVASWPTPRLTILLGTQLGALSFAPGSRQRPVRMEDQFDALLYLGPVSAMTTAQLSPALCSDQTYMGMRLARLALVPPPNGVPISPADRLKQYCALSGNTSLVTDAEPKITELIRDTIRDAAQGKIDPARLAPESRDRLLRFLQDNGPRFLAPAGPLASLILLADSRDGGKHIRRYRAIFGSGEKVVWTIELSSAGQIVSMDPRPE